MNLCETEDSGLVKLPCYKAVPTLVPLRISALSKLSPTMRLLLHSRTESTVGLIESALLLKLEPILNVSLTVASFRKI